MAIHKILGKDKKIAAWLESLGIEAKATRRVIIDIPYDGAVPIYLEQYADESMFEIGPPDDLGKIKVVKAPTVPPGFPTEGVELTLSNDSILPPEVKERIDKLGKATIEQSESGE
jgi:hypothetical protein